MMISYKKVFEGWDQFFFAPRPTEGMAVFRVIWCSALFLGLLMDIRNVHDFYGPYALLSMETVREQFNFPHLNLFNMFGVNEGTVYGIMFVYGMALLFSIVGFHTRPSLVVALACLISFHQRNIWLLSSSEVLMRLVTLLLACSPCGHSLSIDALLGRKYPNFKKNRDWAPWAWRLIQIQISVVYLWTVFQKSGMTWFDGTALYYATRLDTMKHLPVPYLLDSELFLRFGTWATLLMELALGILIWIKEFRKPLILAGILFHLAIEYVMLIPFFEVIMMILLLNFYTPEEYRALANRVRNRLVIALKESEFSGRIKEKILWATTGQ